MGKVVDPTGVTWRVSRRWYPWRRILSLRDFLTIDTPSGTAAAGDDAAEVDAAPAVEEPKLPKNIVLKVLFLLLGVVVWLVTSAGKVLFYTAVVVFFLVASLVELVLALAIMPVAVVLRLAGMARWHVETSRGGKHYATQHAGDFGAAGALRDRLSEDIAAGVHPPAERAPAA